MLIRLSRRVNGVAQTLSGRVTSGEAIGSLYGRAVRHRELIVVLAILTLAALAHGLNMFGFPYYEDDEGTYMSQAWAVVKEGSLAPYTYWYDHAPLGWIQIAAWSQLTGGFHTFGMVDNSGRVLMLLMQVASTYIIYRIARSISGSVLVATITSLAFALSAYGIYFHRRVLLDNIATFWMLLSILSLVSGRLTLKKVWFSAFALAVSILSKEVTFFLIPALAYLVFYRAHKSHRWFATVGWSAITGSIGSLYVLMATLKDELFPTGTLLGGTSKHVSLLGTLAYQACRGRDGGVFNLDSGFWNQTQAWAQQEPFLVMGGSAATLIAVLGIKRHRLAGIMGLATLSLWAFLGRGGEVIGFYLLPLVPLLALNVGLILGSAANLWKRYTASWSSFGLVIGWVGQLGALVLCLALLLLGYLSPNLGFRSDPYQLWNNEQTNAQKQALSWVQNHLSPKDTLITDNYLWTDLHDPANDKRSYTRAHYYWKVDEDPEIRDRVFHKNWRTADYIVSTYQMQFDARNNGLGLVSSALEYSVPVATFDTGGFQMTIRRVNKHVPIPKQTTNQQNPRSSPSQPCQMPIQTPGPQKADTHRSQQKGSASQQDEAEYVSKVGEIQANSVQTFLDSHKKLLRYDALTADDVVEMHTNQATLSNLTDQVANLDSPQKYKEQYKVFRSAINELHEAARLAYTLAADPTAATQSRFDEYDRQVNEAAARLQRSNDILGRNYKTTEGVQRVSSLS